MTTITRQTAHRFTVVTLALAILLTSGVASAGAQSDSGLDGLWTADEAEDKSELSTLERAQEFATQAQAWAIGVGSGITDRATYTASQATPWSSPPDLDQQANQTAILINSYDEEIVAYLNAETDTAAATVDNTTIHEIRLVNEPQSLSESVYIGFTYNQTAEKWEHVSATTNGDGIEDVDHEHRFRGYLAANTATETDRFINEYVLENRPLADDDEYTAAAVSRYAGPFGSDAQSTLLDDGFEGFDEDDGDGSDS